MKKAVFYTLNGNPKYAELLRISLISLNKSKSDEEIFLFTDLDVSHLAQYCNIVKTEFPDGFIKPLAYRYKLFGELSPHFDKILYLDTDTICINSLDNLWNCLEPGKASVASESAVDRETLGREIFNYDKGINPKKHFITERYWAGPLLNPEEMILYQNTPSICSGVFAGYSNIDNLISSVYTYSCEIEDRGTFADQHALFHTLLRTSAYNYGLQKMVDHNASSIIADNELAKAINNGISILHFAGGVQPTDIKLQAMNQHCLNYPSLN